MTSDSISLGAVSIIIPWIRKDGMERCVEAIKSAALLPPHCYEIIAAEDSDRVGVPRMVKRLTEESSFDLVMFLADDTIPLPGFLTNSLAAMETLPDGWGLVALNDGVHRGHLATHWLADKRLLPLLGGQFFHTGYRHTFCDSELTTRCREMGRYAYAEKAQIDHIHPLFGKAPWDKDYRRVYCERNWAHDEQLYGIRQRQGWPK